WLFWAGHTMPRPVSNLLSRSYPLAGCSARRPRRAWGKLMASPYRSGIHRSRVDRARSTGHAWTVQYWTLALSGLALPVLALSVRRQAVNYVRGFAPWLCYAVLSPVDWRLGTGAAALAALYLLALQLRMRTVDLLTAATCGFFVVMAAIASADPG